LGTNGKKKIRTKIGSKVYNQEKEMERAMEENRKDRDWAKMEELFNRPEIPKIDLLKYGFDGPGTGMKGITISSQL
jgi:hypothetical protein